MTTTTQTPVPAAVLLTRSIRLAKVAAERATADLEHATIEHAERWAALAALEAEYRATMESVA